MEHSGAGHGGADGGVGGRGGIGWVFGCGMPSGEGTVRCDNVESLGRQLCGGRNADAAETDRASTNCHLLS